MAERIPTYYDSTNFGVKPMDPSDKLPASFTPISARSGNEITVQTDGLYVGRSLRLTEAYVTASGTDSPTSGTSAQPFKTLDYALTNLLNGAPLSGDIRILLKAGESFTIANRYGIAGGNLTVGWYGDPLYNTFPGAPISPTNADPSVMADLTRPIIAPQANLVSGQWRIGGFDLVDGRGTVSFPGCRIEVPAAPSGNPGSDAYSQFSDLVIWRNGGTGTMELYGTIVNKTDASLFGLCGLHARAASCSMTGFASQFRVEDRLVTDSTSIVGLAARSYFIKFYPDYPGNNQQSTSPVPTSANSSPGSSILNLMWSETSAMVVTGTRQNLRSFPARFDVGFGIRNYFLNLVRDQQQRSLSVVAAFLF